MYKILKQLDIEMLMRLRFAVDKPEFYHDIDQDIKDLYAYPERLALTYPDEWNFFTNSVWIHSLLFPDQVTSILQLS